MKATTADRIHSNFGKCIKCTKPTIHMSGICKECRVSKCKRCGENFIWRHYERVTCADCEKQMKQRTQFFNEGKSA